MYGLYSGKDPTQGNTPSPAKDYRTREVSDSDGRGVDAGYGPRNAPTSEILKAVGNGPGWLRGPLQLALPQLTQIQGSHPGCRRVKVYPATTTSSDSRGNPEETESWQTAAQSLHGAL